MIMPCLGNFSLTKRRAKLNGYKIQPNRCCRLTTSSNMKIVVHTFSEFILVIKICGYYESANMWSGKRKMKLELLFPLEKYENKPLRNVNAAPLISFHVQCASVSSKRI